MPIYRKVDINFFKIWSEEMAYVLGFFVADGNMIRGKRGNCYISFHITDREILEKIKKVLKSNHKIAIRMRSYRKKQKDGYRLQIGSKEMFSDLEKLGLTPNKSLTIQFPTIPRSYLSHFVRGYFDGDGHVGITTYRRADTRSKHFRTVFSCGFTSGSKDFLKGLHKALQKYAGLQSGSIYYSGGAWRLSFSILDTKKMFKFIYPQNSLGLLYLKRKKDKFKKVLLSRN